MDEIIAESESSGSVGAGQHDPGLRAFIDINAELERLRKRHHRRSAKMRRCGLRRILQSCRSCFASRDSDIVADRMADAALSGVTAVEQHELSKIDFEIRGSRKPMISTTNEPTFLFDTLPL